MNNAKYKYEITYLKVFLMLTPYLLHPQQSRAFFCPFSLENFILFARPLVIIGMGPRYFFASKQLSPFLSQDFSVFLYIH